MSDAPGTQEVPLLFIAIRALQSDSVRRDSASCIESYCVCHVYTCLTFARFFFYCSSDANSTSQQSRLAIKTCLQTLLISSVISDQPYGRNLPFVRRVYKTEVRARVSCIIIRMFSRFTRLCLTIPFEQRRFPVQLICLVQWFSTGTVSKFRAVKWW